MLIKPNKVFNFAKSCLKKLNLDEKKSSRIAELLVKSDMSNHFSHGVIRLIQYHNMVKDKIYKPSNDPSAKKKEVYFWWMEIELLVKSQCILHAKRLKRLIKKFK